MSDRLQFSIRSLLFLTALIALSLAGCLWKPSPVSLAARTALAVFIGSLAIVASNLSSGAGRAFWIGVSAPMAVSAFPCAIVTVQLVRAVSSLGAGTEHQLEAIGDGLNGSTAFSCFAPINGILCALAYRLLVPKHMADVDAPPHDS